MLINTYSYVSINIAGCIDPEVHHRTCIQAGSGLKVGQSRLTQDIISKNIRSLNHGSISGIVPCIVLIYVLLVIHSIQDLIQLIIHTGIHCAWIDDVHIAKCIKNLIGSSVQGLQGHQENYYGRSHLGLLDYFQSQYFHRYAIVSDRCIHHICHTMPRRLI